MSAVPLAVVIVSFNTRCVLRSCLDSVVAADAPEIVVVDNGSTDGSIEMVRSKYPDVSLIVNAANRGYGAAANQGVRACSAPAALLLNSDTLLPGDALEAIATYLGDHPDAGIVGPRLINPDGSLQSSTFPFPSAVDVLLAETGLHRVVSRIPYVREHFLLTWGHDRPRRVPWVTGAALGIRRTAFDAVDGFDEEIFFYGEEIDLACRMAKAGFTTHFAPVTEIVHIKGASSGTRLATYPARMAASRRYLQRHSSERATIAFLSALRAIVMARLVRDHWILWVNRGHVEERRDALATWRAMLADRDMWRP